MEVWLLESKMVRVVHPLWNCLVARKTWKHTFLADVNHSWNERFYELLPACSCGGKRLGAGVVVSSLGTYRMKDSWKLVAVRSKCMVGCIREGRHIGRCGRLEELHNERVAVTRRQLQWRYPNPGFVKLNDHGVVISELGRFGMGAICRDHHGVCLGVLATPGTGFPSSMTCETMALVDAKNDIHAFAAIDGDSSPDGELVRESEVFTSSFQYIVKQACIFVSLD